MRLSKFKLPSPHSLDKYILALAERPLFLPATATAIIKDAIRGCQKLGMGPIYQNALLSSL